ncbi:cytochrome P450 [Herbidospora sp. NBRC 101105]|uniref:cytochrome P450 n=1 Tax=Herbidospora sp. NBRC 101105 TaxID=3032195 RepID=UPI0024A28FC2|nr:cytochrome P450 [Herbidospora sp. NBRC 101105]GLX97301.1 fatty-acid peroxygenase [Herbidospora sp. NBRC 101105]
MDHTLDMLAGGYAWLPGLLRRADGAPARTRVMGRPAVALRGPEAARFFYDERHVTRAGALPEPIRATLTGKGTVHGLDGPAHRARKAMFLALLADPGHVADLVREVGESWDERAAGWPSRPRVVLFDEASRAITAGVCRWAGVPVDDLDALAADMVALVDGFGSVGARHWRGRRARLRREAWLADLLAHDDGASAGLLARHVTRHRDADGEPLNPRLAAVEMLNVIRPTVAVAWYVTFAAHALHRWPEHRPRLRDGDPAFAEAFAQEVRRFYPFAPYVGGRAVQDLTWRGEPVPEGTMILLDVYGQHHDEARWKRPYSFRPERFLDAGVGRDDLIPQGGGDPHTGHRCPGEAVTVGLLRELSVRLARLRYSVPPQDLRIPLRRIPTLPRSGFVMAVARQSGG